MEKEINCMSYWYLNDKNTLCISNLDFIEHLNLDLGYCHVVIHGVRTLVRIINNVVEVIYDKTFIVNEELKWLDTNFGYKIEQSVYKNDLKAKLLNKIQFLLNDASLTFLPLIYIDPHSDTSKEVCFYFKNVIAKITTDKISLIDYKDLDGYVMKEQIIDRTFELPKCDDIFTTPYAQFCYNICNQDDQRFMPLMTMNGYMQSRYQDPANTKAVILLDAHINELDGQVEGGRGKSLQVQGLSHMRNLVDIDGKEFKSSNDFKFGKVTANTNIVCINDLKPNENFENHFGLTEGITINEKYKPVIKLDFKDSPKRIFTSNHMPKAPSGNSTDRRLYLFELGDYYNKDRTVHDEHGHYFFYDWTPEQWNEFTFFMLCCAQLYLQKGLVSAPSIYIEQRRLITEVGVEYIDFFDEIFATAKKTKFHKKELYKEFASGGYLPARYRPTQRSFTMRLHKYLAYKGITYTETPLNTKAYIQIVDEAYTKQQELITINDVNTNYKTVDTPRKMTRMVNVLTKYFETTDTKLMAVDLETTSLNPLDGTIVSIALSIEKHKGYNVVFPKHRTKVKQFIAPLLPFLQDGQIAKVFHNYKFDYKFLSHYGIALNGAIHDTLILDHLLDPNRSTHGLKEISELHLGYKQISFKQMLDGRDISEVPLDELTMYAVEDADLTLQLYHYLTQKLNENEQ